ncbi:hypothetical protein MHB71_00040 [Paenibacillus sp. FSL H7-0940]|uniref:hypothetical protein n=1 Tax=Paenibacillus sp. FSL H7-0940 TaxID=2921443 RepID=UPI0030EEDF21
MKDLYKADYDNLPPDEKAAWNYDHYQRTRATIDKYFVSHGLDVALVVAMMERAKESDIRYSTMIRLIDAKLLLPFSEELSWLESLFADLFREVLRPLPNENKF